MPRITFLITILCWMLPAYAEVTQGPTWTLNGYGTFGAAHSNEDRADYHPNPLKPDGPGHSGAWTASLDSVVAAQVGFHPTSRLSAVVQVVSEDRVEDGWEPKLEWANVSYSFSPNVAFRVGRTALDTFLVSAHRKVGYALPWVRPPAELYGMSSITYSDGADVSFRLNRGEVTYRGQIHYGKNGIDEIGGVIEAEQIWAFSNSVEWGPATLHAAYQSMEIRSPFSDDFFALFDDFGPEGEAIQRRYDPTGKWMTFLGLGGSYDPGDWFVMAEWGRGDSRSVAGIAEAWYVTGGWRFGRWTPYATFAESDRGHDLEVSGLTVSAYPPALAPVVMGLNAVLAEARRTVPVQQTLSVGTRWDVARNVALKAQYDHVDVGAESIGTFDNLEPGFRPAGADVFTLTIDFLF